MTTIFQKCINNSSKTYHGREESPLGFGYDPEVEFTGTIMNGKDGKLYTVKAGTKYKKWVPLSIDLKSLPDDCYHEAKIPITRKISFEEETGLEEKLGGSKPFSIEGDCWPIDSEGNPYLFIAQFKHPENMNKMVVFFIDQEFVESDITEYDLDEETLKKQIIITCPENDDSQDPNIIYDPYIIDSYEIRKELKPLSFLNKRLRLPENEQFRTEYYASDYFAYSGLKIGGTAFHCQQEPTFNKLLQLSDNEILPVNLGDCGVGQIIQTKYGSYSFLIS
jgi:uncharacterized protein YwqG